MSRCTPRHTAIAAMMAVAVIAACRGDPASPAAEVFDVSESVVSVVSTKGGTAIDPAAGLTVTFNHAMMHTDSMQVVLHEGDRSGPVVAATTAWSADRKMLTLTPSSSLKARTAYTVEVRCANAGDHSPAEHAAHHGDAAMGGMHNASGGMMGGQGMSHADMPRGAHGMTFGFTTS